MRKKILLVGEAPGKKVEQHPNLWLRPDSSGKNHSANRLLSFTGWTVKQYLEIFDRTNFYETAQNNKLNGNTFPMPRHFDRAEQLLNRMDTKCCGRAVLLGRRVTKAFGMKPEWFKWVGGIVAIPHPSGRNRWWNNKGNRREAKKFFKKLLEWWTGEEKDT